MPTADKRIDGRGRPRAPLPKASEASEPQRRLAKNLRKRRVEANLTVADVSDATGLPANYIYGLENGKGSPTIRTLCKIAKALKCEAWEVVLWATPGAARVEGIVNI